MTVILQRSSNRNLMLSPNQQAAYGELMIDPLFTQRQRFDPSSAFTPRPSSRNDKAMAGKGTEFATDDQITAWDVSGTIKTVADEWFMGWALAFLFGQDVTTGAGPYQHAFAISEASATMPCTNVYVEETNDVKRKYQDMSAKSISIDIPERGDISVSLDMVGTGRWTNGVLATGLPPDPANVYFLSSDILITITPTAGAAVSFVGRQKGISIKIDRGTAPFESSGDGLYAALNAAGETKFSVDFTVAANVADDINGWFENGIRCNIGIGTSVYNARRVNFSFNSVRLKANKISNANNVVTWAASFDETTTLQQSQLTAINAYVINDTPAYLVPA